MLYNATDFLLVVNDEVLGHSKNTTFNIENKLIETTTKDSNGWQEFISGVKGGKLTTKGLTDYSDALNYEQLVDYLITRQKVNIYFKDFTRDKIITKGSGYITEISETAEKEGAVSFSLDITLQGRISLSNQRVWNTIFEKWNEIFETWNSI